MFGRYARIFCVLALAALLAAIVVAGEPTASPQVQLIVLRNGEVLRGAISRQDDRILVVGEGSEIRLPARNVDFECQSLDDAYSTLARRIAAESVDDHLNLAQWCLRQGLTGYAAKEISAAIAIDPRNPKISTLDRCRQQALQAAADSSSLPESSDTLAKPAAPVSADELDRLVRSLAPGAVESFKLSIQPILLAHCATAGCHGPNSSSAFALTRPLDDATSRRLTQRNLYNTLRWIDHSNPAQSKLLTLAREPHGTNQSSPTREIDAVNYQ